MDQDAFRSLLATPARSSDQGRSPSSRAPTSRFGIAPPKRALAQSSSKDLATDLKPRKVAKPKRNPDGSLYRDRAAERRAGRDGDFADAEKLLEDFKTRSETAGVSKDVLEDQMKYLGGDEHHSILVKGLDIALLERKKAELAQKAERQLDDVEDELDTAFNENPAAAPSPPRSSTSKVRAGGAESTLPKRKKTRDELIAEMKAMRAGQATAGATTTTAGDPEGAGSRFKPIGSTSTDKKGKGKEIASGGWKTVGGAGDGGEKKKRKKRKVVVPPTAAAANQTLSSAAPDSATASAPPSNELPSSAPVPAPVPVPDDDDDDMDIFGDVGDYKGLDTDEESDAGGQGGGGGGGGAAAAAPAISTSTSTGTGKRKYFDDDDDEEDQIGTSTAPTGLEDLAARQAAANAAAAAAAAVAGGAGPSAGTGTGAGAGGGEEDEARGEEDRPMRLEGLSGAGPSVKELLEMDKAAEAEEKRQAPNRIARRKLKAKEKAEARRANMTEADKANQDYQKMMAHLEKKDGGPGGGGGKKHST
ncbi:hypothetical protein RHOSPDRAFT_33636 [Rhodotorula sp. JG-1b]|nr:hypothetical protein RHOSPDRAFT_33636 [Rhodotorula sp. JG-1b]